MKFAVATQQGKHTRKVWRVDSTGSRLDSGASNTVTIDGVSIDVLVRQRTMCMKVDTASLTWLVTSLYNERVGVADAVVNVTSKPPNAIEDIVRNLYDDDDINNMASHEIKWRPSKRTLLYPDPKSTTSTKLPAKKIALKINGKRFKRYGIDKFSEYADRRARKALRRAINDIEGAGDAPHEDTPEDCGTSSASGAPRSTTSDSDV